MKIGVLGTGVVGEAIASALIANGHYVSMGSRQADNERSAAWSKKMGANSSTGIFNDTAAYGEIIFLCLNGEYALNALNQVTPEFLANKIIVDITNPLDFTHGMPPRILQGYNGDTSLGEEIQKALPQSFVVKTLNTVNYKLMVDARTVHNGDHHLFICGNDIEAKNKVKHFLVDNFHWKADHMVDLGSIESARSIEAIVPFWVSVWQALGTPLFNFKVVQ